MKEIRNWAASVIAASVLAGITELVLPKSNMEKPLKVMLSLFMLVTFVSPAVSLFTKPEQTVSGLDKLLDEYEAQQALEQTVRETLEKEIITSIRAYAETEGIVLENVKATVSVGNDHIITVSGIEIWMNGTAEEIRTMKEYVFHSFSVDPSIQAPVIKEGRKNKDHEQGPA